MHVGFAAAIDELEAAIDTKLSCEVKSSETIEDP